MRSTVDVLMHRGALAALRRRGGLRRERVPATAQTYGLATMQPGTLAHTVGSAIAKVLKEKGGLNTLVQATAGETVLIPMVARGEIDLGIANMLEVMDGVETGAADRAARDRLDLHAAHRLLLAQGQRHHDGRRPQGQAGAGRLFGHAHARQELARHAGDRRPHAQRRQAGHGAERVARRR